MKKLWEGLMKLIIVAATVIVVSIVGIILVKKSREHRYWKHFLDNIRFF